MEFKSKEFDGEYEVSEVQINNEGQIFRGLLYFPAEKFKKPYSIILYFHGFPQLFALTEIIKSHSFLLDLGYSFMVFNFRGYRFSEGGISIKSQISDGLKVIEFIKIMNKEKIFDKDNINIIGYDFGAYIALILCSKIKGIKKLLLISPILNLKKHVYNEGFKKALSYINRFLPGYIKGIENIDEFIELTKGELNNEDFQIDKVMKALKIEQLKIIVGEHDKITPISEVKEIIDQTNIRTNLSIIKNMDHDCTSEEEQENLNKEIIDYFKTI
ncbi:MAG: alpha/beta hydrolase family protein [Promethearchaeota archaeon]